MVRPHQVHKSLPVGLCAWFVRAFKALSLAIGLGGYGRMDIHSEPFTESANGGAIFCMDPKCRAISCNLHLFRDGLVQVLTARVSTRFAGTGRKIHSCDGL